MTQAAELHPPIDRPVPSRYRADPAWSERAAAPLRLVAGPGARPSPEEVEQLKAGLLRRDEPAAALVRAVREDRTVTMKQIRAALDAGVTDDSPAALRDFFDHLAPRPAWVRDDLLERGARACRRLGVDGLRVLGLGSLLGGYRTAAALEPLVRTGRLTGEEGQRRLNETTAWWIAVTAPGGLAPGAEGWRLSVHVRIMHAFVNDQLEQDPTWDWDLRGVPINQYDQASTLGVFSTSFLLHARLFGLRVSRRDSEAIMHLWSYVGWLMGVDEQWLPRTERIGRRLLYQFLAGDPGPDQNTRLLARSLIDAVDTGPGSPAAKWFERERTLSIATGLLGPGAMRDLGLPARPPWFTLWRCAVNLPLSQVLGRIPGTDGLTVRRGNTSIARECRRIFGEEGASRHGVGPIPA
ncbi:oxygenase MpaB family protein [Nocardioides sp. AE5]|uniref:oxygenase MpaB family protein n=1 Tax=Nocardioides sp. AE5 TaxID=2962573 RepID=UPI00288254C9|nr:oxygenase MpaB family protein [Nocardioides sp. AE5]MDT0201919.1 oxygenase MpaB family protein [Nocardioides sp. AE5]